MNRLSGIPVRVENDRNSSCARTIGGGIRALLTEILAALERLRDTGEPRIIDIRSLPMAPGDLETLRDTLGEGEIHCAMQLGGDSYVRETRFPGVWWVRHEGEPGHIVAETIEITRVPDILLSQPEDVETACVRLAGQLCADSGGGGQND